MRIQFGVLLVLIAFLSTGACVNRRLGALNPCLVTSFANQVTNGINKLDLLFVIDNSNSMVQEQAKVRDKVSDLVDQLLLDTPLTDLHVGVITTEGAWKDPNHNPGIDPSSQFACDYVAKQSDIPVPNPNNIQLAGLLKLTNMGMGACPSMASGFAFREPGTNFLSFDKDTDDPGDFSTEVECIIAQGTGGCGIEQPLNAMATAIDHMADGGPNEGFLRADAVLAVITVTDEDDCSAPQNSWLFDIRAYSGGGTMPNGLTGNPFRNDYPTASGVGGGLIQFNQICAIVSDENPGVDSLIRPMSYFRGKLVAAKGGDENLVLFATITGAPNTLLDEPDALLNYDQCLADECDPASLCPSPTMSPDFVGDKPTMKYYDSLATCRTAPVEPACVQGTDTIAVPGRRLVQFAKDLNDHGGKAQIETICASDYGPAIDDIAAAIGELVGSQCLPRAQNRNNNDEVVCQVIEILPAGIACDDPSVPAGRDPVAIRTEGGRQVCLVNQLPVPTPSVPAGDGWYYDDFSAGADACPPGVEGTSQRVAFTTGDEPISGSEVRFECFQAVAPNGVTEASDRGTPCNNDAECLFNGESEQDQADRLEELYNEPNLLLQCDGTSLTCQLTCTNDAECPGGFDCYDRETPADTSDDFCVIPTCTLGLGLP